MSDQAKKVLTLATILAVLCLTFAAGQGGGCNLAGDSPPFATDKLAVLIVEETEQRTLQQDAVEAAVRQAVATAGGQYRRLDKDQTDLSKDEPWVAAAWKAKGVSVPWIVAANKRTGVNQALPAAPDEALKLLSPLGVSQ